MNKIRKCVFNCLCLWLLGMTSISIADPLPNDYYYPRPAPPYILDMLGWDVGTQGIGALL